MTLLRQPMHILTKRSFLCLIISIESFVTSAAGAVVHLALLAVTATGTTETDDATTEEIGVMTEETGAMMTDVIDIAM